MSEFKFNCPVCGQHIASDSGASDAQIECPTCFQPIIVPQAPKSHSKYILSATQYIKPQPTPRLPPVSVPAVVKPRTYVPELFVALFFVCVIGVALYVVHSRNSQPDAAATMADSTKSVDGSSLDKNWRLNLADVSFPDAAVAGRVCNRDFTCDRVYMQNGALALRQGPMHQPEVVVNVYFSTRESQELAGKRFNIETNDSGSMPWIVVRWKERNAPMTQTFTNGYAMKLEFGSVAADRMPGRIYLCMPDIPKSYVAGNFNAELRKLSVPKLQ